MAAKEGVETDGGQAGDADDGADDVARLEDVGECHGENESKNGQAGEDYQEDELGLQRNLPGAELAPESDHRNRSRAARRRTSSPTWAIA